MIESFSASGKGSCAAKPLHNFTLYTLHFTLFFAAAFNADAMPLKWRADWPGAKPVEALVHRGTDIELQPQWYINGEAAASTNWTFQTFVQTNSQAQAEWFGPLPGAFFSHTNDVGANFYNVMVRAEMPGGEVNYTAFARLRMLDSPGYTPGALPLPVKKLDFANIEVANAPWDGEIASIRVELGSNSVAIASNSVAIATLSDSINYTTNNATLVSTVHASEIDPTVPAWAKGSYGDLYNNLLYQLLNQDFFAKDSNIQTPKKMYLTGNASSVTVGKGPTGSSYPYSQLSRNRLDVYGSDMNHVAQYRQEGVKVWPWWDDEAEDYATFLFPTNSAGGTFALESSLDGKQDKLPYSTNAIPQSAVSGLTTDYLRLSGGTMTGDITTLGKVVVTSPENGDVISPYFTFTDTYGMVSEVWFVYESGLVKLHYAVEGEEVGRYVQFPVPNTDTGTLAFTDDVSAAATAATNYTDSAIADADTTYRMTVGITNLNQTVQYVNAPASATELAIELPTGSGTKDWIVYVNAATNMTLVLPPATWWMADTAYTNALEAASKTALYFSQVTDGTYILGRQAMEAVVVPEVTP